MMTYKILSDSCCDYTTYAEGMPWLERIPLTIELDGQYYLDDPQLDCADLIVKMAASAEAPRSACPSPGIFLEYFEKDAADDIYVVTLSEKISGTYNSACNGAELFKESHPGRNIHVFNSRSAAAGEVAVCLKLHELLRAGYDFATVVEETEAYIQSLSTLFALETLEVFKKNGRLGHLQAILTSALKIKLVMGADAEGSIEALAKALSMGQAIMKMVSLVKERGKDMDLSQRLLVISHCNCPERAERIRDLVQAECNFRDILICRTGGISTMYANSGGVVVSF